MGGQNPGQLRSRPGACTGFTAVELMVTVTVIAIIAAIAYPAYTDFIQRSRRSEAMEALQNLSTLQEQYYNDNKAYSNSLPALGMSATTANAYYRLSIAVTGTVAGTIQSYTLRASALGSQAGDTDCATMQIDSNGNKAPSGCW